MNTEVVKSYIVSINATNQNGTSTFTDENGAEITPIRAKQTNDGGAIYIDAPAPFRSVGYSILAIRDQMHTEDDSSDVLSFTMTYEVEPEKDLNPEQLVKYIQHIVYPTLAWILMRTLEHAISVNTRVEEAYEKNPEAFESALMKLEAKSLDTEPQQ
jgi:hypothetical protein